MRAVDHVEQWVTIGSFVHALDESVGLDRIKRSFEELIEYLRLNNPIQDGAVLSTGTGIIVPPELALREGDEIEMVCEPIGTLRHTMRQLPRDWTP